MLSLDLNSHPIFVVLGIAVLASLLAEIRIGALRVPVVVSEMLFGILIGPQVFNLVKPGALLLWLGNALGLSALFFMAGMELDLQKVKGRPLTLALRGWVLSLAIALFAAAFLHWLPFLHAPMLVGLILTTTAMGTFLPILRDAGNLDTQFGTYVLAAGAVGEFAPIIVVSLVVTHEYGAWQEVALILGFAGIAIVAALTALGLRPPRVLALLQRSMHSSTQLPIAISVLLLASFDLLSQKIGLEAVVGAFAAGMIVGLASQGDPGKLFRQKMEALSFGFFVPFFFVVSGINLDIGALVHSSKALLLVPLFLLLFVLVRGVPVFLYGDSLAPSERLPFALYSATALPMVVAITNLGVSIGRITAELAAALVGSALLSVLLFPTLASALIATRKDK